MAEASMIEVVNVHKRFGPVHALNGVSLQVEAGEVVCLIGPSGSGKSTLLRCMNFLEEPSEGVIRMQGLRVGYREVNGVAHRSSGRELAAMRADIGMVFQLFYLWPHLSALENVVLGLTEVRGLKMSAAAQRKAWPCSTKVGMAHKRNAYRGTYPGATASAWPSRGRLPCSPRSCCSTNRPRRSTRNWWERCWR